MKQLLISKESQQKILSKKYIIVFLWKKSL